MDPSSFAAKERLIPQDDMVPGKKWGGADLCYAKHEIVCAALLVIELTRHSEAYGAFP